ncbi:hypothetical protein [Saccharopolyspora spinosa]|uniref:hypothetical protein n=1 Tax=Saccharopolyspora spinosa TaxID=60894 RepID=UPI000C6F1CD3|nr:hypothetical protein [Saccharopolyspora spinosa]
MQTIVIPVQAERLRLLGTSSAGTPWVITPIAGRLGDIYGKRRVVLALLVLLVAGAVIGALTSTLVPAILARTAGNGRWHHCVGDLDSPRRTAAEAVGTIDRPGQRDPRQNSDWHVLFWGTAAIGTACLVLCVLVVPPSTHSPGEDRHGAGQMHAHSYA